MTKVDCKETSSKKQENHFMNKNQIFIKSGTEYKKMTKELLTSSNLAELIGDRHKMVGIKPNLVSPSDPSEGGTTHPEIVAGILEYLKENGFQNMMILEGSWVGDRTADAFEVCGYRSLCENYDVKFYDTQKDKSYVKNCSGLELKICESVKKVDFLINVPVMKGHCQTKITCALKNMKGLIPNTEKRHFHAMGLHKPIAHLNTGIHQDFIVVDNICGDLDFEDGGNPVVMNRIWTAMDPVLVDACVCKQLHYEVEEVPYVKMAAELGVGCADISKADIQILGEAAEHHIAERRKVVDVADAVEEVESCSACYGYLIPAPETRRPLRKTLRKNMYRTGLPWKDWRTRCRPLHTKLSMPRRRLPANRNSDLRIFEGVY